MDTAAYISALINQPWARDGRHCWRLVIEVQRDLFGVEVPPIVDAAPGGGGEGRQEKARLFAQSEERKRWTETIIPVDGAVALMRRSAQPPRTFIHAGVYLALEGGGVLHTDNPHGVVFDTMPELNARGWVPTFFLPRQ
jgi:hypothetical protein